MSHPFLAMLKPTDKGLLRDLVDDPATNMSSADFVSPQIDEACRLYKAAKSKLEGQLQNLQVRQQAACMAMQEQGFYLQRYRANNFPYVLGLVTGLGEAGAVENAGITHTHSHGIPYVPGARIKGILRKVAFELGHEEEWIKIVFGQEGEVSDSNKAAAGRVRFLDVYPVKIPELTIEILTPHYPLDYTDDNPPGDWHAPVPNKFLSVKQLELDLCFLIPEELYCEEFCDFWHEIVETALMDYGIGGKTSSGFGRFDVRKL